MEFIDRVHLHCCLFVGVASVRHQSRVANSGRPYAVALHPFHGAETGDLTFDKGDLIELLGNVSEGSWIKGRLGSVTGIFPSEWVRGGRGVGCLY